MSSVMSSRRGVANPSGFRAARALAPSPAPVVRYPMHRFHLQWFRDLSLGRKFLVSFGLVLLVLVLSLSAILFYLTKINSYVERHHRITVPAIMTAVAMRERAFQMHLALPALLDAEASDRREQTANRLASLESEFHTFLDVYQTKHAARKHPILFGMLTRHGQAGLADEEDASLARTARLLEEVSGRWRAFAADAARSNVGNAKLAIAEAEDFSRQLTAELSRIMDLNSKITAEMKAEGERLLRQARLVIVALVVLLGALIVATYMMVSRQIAWPLRRLAATADRVTHHDLSAGFDRWSASDEVGALAQSLNAMLGTLRERTVALERKTRELEAFTYSVAHDLKGPLREIEGFSSLIEQKFAAPLEPTARHYVAIIRTSALRLTVMIDALLQYSRLEQQDLPKSRINLRTLVEQVIEDRLHATGGERPRITVDLPFSEVWGEPASIRQALVNLVDNALKFSRGSTPPEISVGGALQGRERILWIRDNGIGFEPKDTDKIFGLFERLHTPGDYEGTGVGLAIVKLVMEKHGGRVWAESSSGKGSVFYLAFPNCQ